MKKKISLWLCGLLTVWLLCGVSSAAWSDTRPWLQSAKNLRFRYATSGGAVVEDIDYDLYYFSYEVSERIQRTSFIANNGVEYDIVGHKLELFRNLDYTDLMSEDTACKDVADAWNRVNDQFASDDPPLSMTLTCVLRPTGAIYTNENLVRVILLDQNNNQFAELETGTITYGEYFYATPPQGYEILSAKASMMTIWNTSQPVDFSVGYPVIYFSSRATEYLVMYKVYVEEKPEESSTAESSRAETKQETTEAAAAASTPAPNIPTLPPPVSAAAETAYRRETDENGREVIIFTPTGGNTESKTTKAGTEAVTSKTYTEKPDESFHTPGKLILIGVGAVLALGIFLVVIAAGERRRRKAKRRKKRL